jgi:hypothetical protein
MITQNTPVNGDRQSIDGVERVFYDGYWIKYYAPPADSLQAKKQMIISLTRRLFNHVEHGLNIPGVRLKEARQFYEAESDQALKRVKGAMLAGCLFNRATDIITNLVELQSLGIDIHSDNALLRACGQALQEALSLGRLVLHRSGEECIDELWGEPLHAFSVPVDVFYESRFIKISSARACLDAIHHGTLNCFNSLAPFTSIEPLMQQFTAMAHVKVEVLQDDDAIFDVWPAFVVAGEAVIHFEPKIASQASVMYRYQAQEGKRLLIQIHSVMSDVVRARTPMPKTMRTLIERLNQYQQEARLIFSEAPPIDASQS